MAPQPLFHYRVLASRRGRWPTAVRRVLDMSADLRDGADPDWLIAYDELLPRIVEVYDELLALHVGKAETYGTVHDKLANYTGTAWDCEMDPEAPPVLRIREKWGRIVNMLEAGHAADVDDYPDIAALALIAEALRRRRS